MATNLDELRQLLLAVQAQIESSDAAVPAAAGEDQLPALAEQLADHLVHPTVLRDVLLSFDARLRELETPPAPDATGASDPAGGE